MKFSTREVSEHFNNLAMGYGRGSAKGYYNQMIYKLMRKFMRNASTKSVLDVGCGNGDFLRWLKPKSGVGIDVSQKMINIANKTGSKNLKFYDDDIVTFKCKNNFDYIVMIDVIEHLSDLKGTVKAVKDLCGENTRIIMSFSNPFWTVPFKIFEFLGVKDPEGPHNLTSIKKLRRLLHKNNLKVVASGYRLLFPLKIPILAEFFNPIFYKIPLLRNLGMTQFVICRLAKSL